MGEWIRTADQLPEENELVLTYRPQYSWSAPAYRFRVMYGFQVRLSEGRVTHWMYLPEEPEEV